MNVSIDAFPGSMSDSGLRPIAGVTSGETFLGGTVTWRARHFGLPFTLSSVISAFERPTYFVDEQTKGPFKRWWHAHSFETAGEGTLQIDVIEFEAPFGVLGRVVEHLILQRYMTRLIDNRNQWLKTQLEQGRSQAG